MTETKIIPFARLARNYLSTLAQFTEAKAAVSVVQRLGQDSHDIERHSDRLQEVHKAAFKALVSRAVELHQAQSLIPNT